MLNPRNNAYFDPVVPPTSSTVTIYHAKTHTEKFAFAIEILIPFPTFSSKVERSQDGMCNLVLLNFLHVRPEIKVE